MLNSYEHDDADRLTRSSVAHIHEDLTDSALEMMERNVRAELTSCADVSF
jgi:hypothetical protein